MKITPILCWGAVLGALTPSLLARDPILATPGTAVWRSVDTATGTRTIFKLRDNTVLNWDQLRLAEGSELVFRFKGGESVVNFLGGTATHAIDGRVTSNGIVAFFSPTADLEVNGSIIAKGVTLATLDADPGDFSNGGRLHLDAASPRRILSINGTVRADEGDVLLAGETLDIGDQARIDATGVLRMAGGTHATVSKDGTRTRGKSGIVSHLGEARASGMEISAARQISNQGRLDAGRGRVFLQVGNDGQIVNDGRGLIVGHALFDGADLETGAILVPDEGDVTPTISEGMLTIPGLSRPGGQAVLTRQVLVNSAPTSATGDALRDSPQAGQTLRNLPGAAANGAGTRGATATRQVPDPSVAKKSMLQRTSFFGVRGGSTPAGQR